MKHGANMTDDSAKRMKELFAGFEGLYGTHGEPTLDENGLKWPIKKTARTLKGNVTVELWQKHLNGEQPLGVLPCRIDSTVKWGCIDIDHYDIDNIEVVQRVENQNLPFVPCRSKSGGLHLYMFFAEPVAAVDAQNLLRDLAAVLGFAGSEIFPKQTKVQIERGDQGNWMVMPYFGGDFNGKLKMQRGLKKTGAEMTVVEFLAVAEQRKVTVEMMVALAKPRQQRPVDGKRKKVEGKEAGAERTDVPFSDGPPCLENMAGGGFPEGGRNNALFHIGVYLKKAHPSDWKKHLENDNQLYMKPPLPAAEVAEVIKSLDRKEYEYKCKDEPMKSYCQSGRCRARRYGVGGDGGVYPEITRLAMLKTDPPLWFVSLPGGKELALSTDELQNYRKFHKACLEKASTSYRSLSEPAWFAILNEVMSREYTEIKAPDDLSTDTVFLELLETFLTNRMRGKFKEDILRGVPWEDEEAGRHYFRLKDLQNFLSREGFKETRPRIVRRLEKDLDGGSRSMEIKGRNVACWFVPSSAIIPAPELDIPELKQEEM